MRKLKIIALSKRKIVYRYPKKEQKKEWIAIAVSFFLILFCAFFLKVQKTTETSEFFDTVAEVVNPDLPLYKEMNEIVFTSSDGELVFSVPVMSFESGSLVWNL